MRAAELLSRLKPKPARVPRVSPQKPQGPRKRAGGKDFAPHVCVYLPDGEIEQVKRDAKELGYRSVSEYARAAFTKFRQVCNNG